MDRARLFLGVALACLATARPAGAQPVRPAEAPEAQTLDTRIQPVEPPHIEPELAYEPGRSPPPGYRVVRGPHRGLVAGGASLFAFSYAVAIVAARAELDFLAGDDPEREPARNRPLYAPLIGPFVAAVSADRSGGEYAVLLLDGMGQAVGLGLLLAGFATEEVRLVRDRPGEPPPRASLALHVSPTAAFASLRF
jgi:hypothetical protein